MAKHTPVIGCVTHIVTAQLAILFTPPSQAWHLTDARGPNLEIRAGLAPLGQLAYSHEEVVQDKIPDVLLQLTTGMAWVEVENSWRSDKDLAKVVACMRTMFVDRRISEIHFVITAPGAKNIGARLRKALTHDAQSGWPRQIKELDSKILQGFIRIFTLNGDTLELLEAAI